ncbi:hypothetical protein AVEN_180820-1 [Araneus ventricosus]|uniref:HAT C-terminal dimerisation domain-containing protein n=1 Tax=Araneus ventricosus TaxID=182803 RepID=A0A4Y2SRZ4_ARAVE|nr:hypothetical protein AVEN_180820-1 [Araneus ventricosus]
MKRQASIQNFFAKSVNRPVSDSAHNASSCVANTSTVDPARVTEDFNQERFESHKETVATLQHILPEFCTKTDFSSLDGAFNFYEEDLSHKEVVQSEFMLSKEKWSQEKPENLPKIAISSLEKCDKTFFLNIYIHLKLLAVLPVSVATVERSFSSLRRLKTYLRNITSESRLNRIALLSIYRDIKISDEEVLDKFASVPRNLTSF